MSATIATHRTAATSRTDASSRTTASARRRYRGPGLTATNARDYAIADGTTDDTAALQSALTAAAAGTKALYLPQGTYKISGASGTLFQLGTTEALTIFGDGPRRTVLLLTGQVLTSTLYLFRMSGWYQGIEDLEIRCSGLSGSGDVFAINPTQGAFYPHVTNVEISGLYGTSDAGGVGITTYQAYNQDEVSTTLGTAVGSAGSATCSPPDMRGIYVGRRLVIDTSGSAETVVVTARTQTSFTAAFAGTHSSGAAVRASSRGNQFGTYEDVLVRDCALGTGYVVNSLGNVFRGCRAHNCGSLNTQHGFYFQAGNNVFEGCHVEGAYGVSFNGHKDVPDQESGGDRIIGCTSINAQNYHVNLDVRNSDGSTDEYPSTTPLNRFAVVADNVFRASINGPALASGVAVYSKVPCIVANNVIEDTGGYAIGVDAPSQITGNQIRATNRDTAAFNVNGADVLIQGNYVQGAGTHFNLRASSSRCHVKDNHVTGASGNVFEVASGCLDCEVSGNDIAYASTGQFIWYSAGTPTGWRIHDNRVVGTGSSHNLGTLPSGMTGYVYNNEILSGKWLYTAAGKDLVFRDNALNLALSSGQNTKAIKRGMGRLLALLTDGTALTEGRLVKLDSSGQVTPCGTSDTVFAGITLHAVSASAATIYVAGLPGTEFEGVAVDGAWTAGHYGVISGTTAGKLHDNGTSPPGSGSYVLFLDTGGSAGDARVLVVKTL